MSAISSFADPALQAAAPTPTVAAPDAANPLSQISSEQFLGIILEELSNQDPFEPNDTSATLEQLNSLRSIESEIELQEQLEALVLQNSIGQAGSLIGRQIDGLSSSGLNVSGIVESVRVVEGEAQLQLDNGSTIDFGNVLNVSIPPAAAPSATTPTPTDVALEPQSQQDLAAVTQAFNDLLGGDDPETQSDDQPEPAAP